MKIFSIVILTLASIGIFVSGAFAALPDSDVPATTTIESNSSKQAIAAVFEMSKYLRTLPSFVVRGTSTIDVFLDSGQLIQQNRTITLKTKQLSHFWAETVNAYGKQEFFFNGNTFTLYTDKYYASMEVKENIAKALIQLQQHYDIKMPLSDLFILGTEVANHKPITAAIIVGDAMISGVPCTQYAFQNADMDWQLWIQNGSEKLPLKMVFVSRNDESKPRYEVLLDWDLTPDLSTTTFVFSPNNDDIRIKFKTYTTQPETN